MPTEPADFVQGTLDLLVLRALALEPMHGYGISQWLRARTAERLAVQDAALYQALRRLERRGWVSAEWAETENRRRARYYELTSRGEEQLKRQASAWREYAAAVFDLLEPAEEG